jgi:hypothetical protein
MGDIEFTSDDPNIQNLAKLVLGLQTNVIQLAQRSEVDMLMISTLLDYAQDCPAMLESWKAKVASYYPSRAVLNLADPRLQTSTDELNRRIAVWTQALEARAHPPGE